MTTHIIDDGEVNNANEENQSISKENEINSYGIPINTAQIQPVIIEEQGKELYSLDVAVYEQSKFEDGIIHQVDSAILKAEKNFKRNIILQEIKQTEQELKTVESEKNDIEKVFSAAKQGDGNATRQVSFSLLQQCQSKENQLKRLKKKLIESNQRLLAVENTDISNAQTSHSDILGPSQSHTDSVRLGEITPFEALQQNKRKQTQQSSKNQPFNEHCTQPSVEQSIATYTNTTTVTTEKVTGSKRKYNEHLSDEDYVPDQSNIISSDEDDFEIGLTKTDLVTKSKKKKISSTVNKKTSHKTVDDGDFSSFRERMRKFQVKKKLKDACRKGEVIEEYNSSDFSEDDIDDDDVTIEDAFVLPTKLWNKLYRYQRVGVKWLWQLHIQQAGGIIGDEMGLGKTIQIIAFLAGLSYSKKGNNSKNKNLGIGPVLIVCPATVMQQWVAEFHKWWPKFRVGILHDSGSFSGKKATLIRAMNSHPGVLITSYAGVRTNKTELYRYYWQYIILDEGHKIRNPDSDVTLACKQFDTPHRLILTGTPMQNSLKELWSLFDFVYPGKLGTLPVFMTEFSVPITMGGYANASVVQVQTAYRCSCVLRDTVGPYLLRRLKKDVKTTIDLPTKNEQVLFCKLTDEQKDLYTEYINSKDVENMLKGSMKVFAGLIKLRKICNHPDLMFLENPDDEKSSNKLTVTREFQGGYGQWNRSGKMVVIESLLRIWKEQGHRVLLFSQSRQMLNIIEKFVQTVGYNYSRMDGTTNIKLRQNMVKTFNEDKSIFVFLLTTRVGGLGLNLIGADRVVIYDPDWNPSTDSQARERSWRIGQDRHVTIYRLMTTGTIEEKIYHRQIFKQFLTNRVLTNPFQRRFFKSNDLYELFTLGDIGPMQSTETGAIFAGTGSEIRLRRKGSERTKATKNSDIKSGQAQNQEKKKKRSSSNTDSRINDSKVSQRRTELKNGNLSNDSAMEQVLHNKDACKENSNTANYKTKKSIAKRHSSSSKERKQKRKRKYLKVDGIDIKNIDKSEVYSKDDSEDETQTSSKKSKQKNEEDILLSLFRTTGLHSALKHDKIEQSGNPDYVLVEKEAERVAKQAVNALKQSRAQCRSNGLSVPTWTGNSSSLPKTSGKKPRFGAKKTSTEANNILFTSSVKPKASTSKSDLKNEPIDVSSSALLARMKNRNMSTIATTSNCFSLPKPQGTSGTTNGNFNTTEEILVKDIQEFISQCPGSVVSTDKIMLFFNSRLQEGQNVVFKQLLKQICTFERKDGEGQWRLKQEFT